MPQELKNQICQPANGCYYYYVFGSNDDHKEVMFVTEDDLSLQ